MKIDLYCLFATLLTLPFAIRKVFWSEQAAFFSEYTDVSLYLFEVFAILYVLLYILEHKNIIKSIYRRMFHVEHIFLLLLFSLSSVLAAIFESSYIGFYFFVRWFLYCIFAVFLYSDLIKYVPRGTINVENNKICSTWNILQGIILVSLIIQAIIIILQFINQKSLGLFMIGESIINPSIAGVSTIIVNNQELLRGYGTFLHPNVAAFFFFTYMSVYFILKYVPRGTILPALISKNNQICSTWNNFYQKISKKWFNMFHVEQSKVPNLSKYVPRGTIYVLWIIIIGAFILTFSKSVLILFFFGIIFYLYISNCSMWNNFYSNCSNMFHVEQSKAPNLNKYVPRGTIICGAIISLLLFSLVVVCNLKQGSFIEQSILERKLQYLSIPYENIIDTSIGNGLGSYVPTLAKKSPGLFDWQLQPIHNTYVLWIFEIGLLPLLGILILLWRPIKKMTTATVEVEYRVLHRMLLYGMFTIALLLAVDHYTWDIEQGQFLFVFFLTFLIWAQSTVTEAVGNTKK